MHFDQGYDAFKSLLVKGDGRAARRAHPRAHRTHQPGSDGVARQPGAIAEQVRPGLPARPLHGAAPPLRAASRGAGARRQRTDAAEMSSAPMRRRSSGTWCRSNRMCCRTSRTSTTPRCSASTWAFAPSSRSLEQRHILDNAIVVLTADHGEEFKEHGLIGHEKTLYEEVVHVPLIMLVPGHSEHKDIDQVVGLVDVTPTLIDMAGGALSPTFEGHSWKQTLARPRRAAGLAPSAHPRPSRPGGRLYRADQGPGARREALHAA